MRVVCGTRSFEVLRLSTDRELKALAGESTAAVMLGKECAHPREFFAVRWPDRWGSPRHETIGIRSEGNGLVPEILLLGPAEDRALVGYNERVAVLRLGQLQAIAEVELLGLFHGFIPVPHAGRVLVVHETGVLALDATTLEAAWEHSRDVVTDVSVRDRDLTVSFLDEGALTVDLRDGRVVR
jgi:hypothetical protein